MEGGDGTARIKSGQPPSEMSYAGAQAGGFRRALFIAKLAVHRRPE
jgi:hypothetical protein